MKTPKSSPYLLILLLVFITSSVQAQWGWNSKKVKGNGNVTTETRSVSDFDEVSAATGLNVVFTQGPKSVKVEADSNLHDYIVTEVKGDRLVVKRKKNTQFKNVKKAVIYVSSPDIHLLSASSGANLKTSGQISTPYMKVNCSSGADLSVNVSAKDVEISSSSGADVDAIVKSERLEASSSSGASINIEGSSNDADLKASSGADIEGKELKVIDCSARASSSGDITVTVSGDLNASASSGGDVNYYGSPESVDRSSSSGGSVKAR